MTPSRAEIYEAVKYCVRRSLEHETPLDCLREYLDLMELNGWPADKVSDIGNASCRILAIILESGGTDKSPDCQEGLAEYFLRQCYKGECDRGSPIPGREIVVINQKLTCKDLVQRHGHHRHFVLSPPAEMIGRKRHRPLVVQEIGHPVSVSMSMSMWCCPARMADSIALPTCSAQLASNRPLSRSSYHPSRVSTMISMRAV